jgi:hypothetical protein
MIKIKKTKPVKVLVRKRDIREAVAELLHGKEYTEEQVKSIAIFDNGRWYKHREWGTFHINKFGRLIVERDVDR